jgi:PhnB protein
MEPADQLYGDRSGGVKDAAGNSWFFGTHIEDVAPAETEKTRDGRIQEEGGIVRRESFR